MHSSKMANASDGHNPGPSQLLEQKARNQRLRASSEADLADRVQPARVQMISRLPTVADLDV
jgi:hypothetical protein